MVLRFRHTQCIYKELGEELRNLDWFLDVKSQLEMSKNLFYSTLFHYILLYSATTSNRQGKGNTTKGKGASTIKFFDISS